MEKSSAAVRRRSFGARSLGALGLALAILAAADPARAQSASAPPPSHEKNAQVAYALQDWPSAIREFEAAFQNEQKPDFLWGIAQSQRLSGDCKAAIFTYKSYLRSEISAEQSAAADSRIQHCEQELQQQAAQKSAAPGAQPQPPHSSPPAPPAAASASTGKKPSPERAEHARAFYSDAFGDTLFLTGLAAAGAGTYFLVAGNSAMSQAKHAAYSSYDSDTRHASREQLVGVTTLAVGGFFVACSVVRFLTLGDDSSGRGAALTVGPLGFDLRGRF